MRLFLIPLLLLSALADDESDFTTAPPADWQRLDPTGRVDFDFSAGDCRITCPVPTSVEHFPPRAYLLAPTEFADTVVVADLTSWLATTDRGIDGCFSAVLTRIQQPAEPGGVSGYSLSVVDMTGGIGRLQIHFLYNESPILIAAPVDFAMDPARDYRLVFASTGSTHIGRVFDTSDLGQPLAQVVALDGIFETGRAGLGVSTDRVVPLDVRFDNFLAWDGSLPPLHILPGDQPGRVKLLRDARRSLAARLESTIDLSGGPDVWAPHAPVSTETVGDQVISHYDIDSPARFFRLATP